MTFTSGHSSGGGQKRRRALPGLVLAVAATSLQLTSGFVPPRPVMAAQGASNAGSPRLYMSTAEQQPPASVGAGGGSSDSSTTQVLARKAKEKEIAAFKASLPRGHPIFTELENVGTYEQGTALWRQLKRKYNCTLSVVPEYARKAKFAYLGSVLEPREFSKIFRDAGAHAIAVNVDTLTGGCSHDDIRQMVEEQNRASTTDVLAPLPIVAADVVVDPVQISRAKLAGAAGITLRYGLSSKEITQELIQVTLGLGMEPIMQVRSAEEAHDALSMGARLLYLIGLTRRQGLEIRDQMPTDAMIGFDLRRPKEYQTGLAEIEDAWVLRDADYHSVYASNLLWQTGLDDVTGPTAAVRALRAKACHFMVEPLDWIEKCILSEGTRETLGELLM